MRIQITSQSVRATARLRDTPTVRELLKALPMDSRVSTWGEEIYFEIPVTAPLEPDAREVVEPGTLCFWVEGHALAIPFGPTPISEGDECRLVTKVNLLGRMETNPAQFKSIHEGDPIRVEQIGD